MARLDMKTQALITDVNINARNTLTELGQIFDRIKSTASELNGVWDDEAQRIFMDKLGTKIVSIQAYIREMNGFFDDLSASVNKVSDWDAILAEKLRDPRLKG